jgi:hypothetical protein
MSERDNWRTMSSLLHDSRVQDIEWDSTLTRIVLHFACLR